VRTWTSNLGLCDGAFELLLLDLPKSFGSPPLTHDREQVVEEEDDFARAPVEARCLVAELEDRAENFFVGRLAQAEAELSELAHDVPSCRLAVARAPDLGAGRPLENLDLLRT
jgi:hypothetical protein